MAAAAILSLHRNVNLACEIIVIGHVLDNDQKSIQCSLSWHMVLTAWQSCEFYELDFPII